MLANPKLWKRLEERCSDLKFGELHVVIKVQNGLPMGCDVRNEVEMIREPPKRENSDEII